MSADLADFLPCASSRLAELLVASAASAILCWWYR